MRLPLTAAMVLFSGVFGCNAESGAEPGRTTASNERRVEQQQQEAARGPAEGLRTAERSPPSAGEQQQGRAERQGQQSRPDERAEGPGGPATSPEQTPSTQAPEVNINIIIRTPDGAEVGPVTVDGSEARVPVQPQPPAPAPTGETQVQPQPPAEATAGPRAETSPPTTPAQEAGEATSDLDSPVAGGAAGEQELEVEESSVGSETVLSIVEEDLEPREVPEPPPNTLDAYIEYAQQRFENLRARWASIEAEIASTVGLTSEYQIEIADTQDLLSAIERQLYTLQNSGGESWREIRAGLQESLLDLQIQLDTAFEEIEPSG